MSAGRGNSGGEFEPFAHEREMATTWLSGWLNNNFVTEESRCVGGFVRGIRSMGNGEGISAHLATIVPAAAAHPGLDYPSYNNIGMTLRRAMVHAYQRITRPG
jgi:hypothetical protein